MNIKTENLICISYNLYYIGSYIYDKSLLMGLCLFQSLYAFIWLPYKLYGPDMEDSALVDILRRILLYNKFGKTELYYL